MLIDISPAFYNDHKDRDLPTPPTLGTRRGKIVIDPDHPHSAELLSDARYYAKDVDRADPGLRRAAFNVVRVFEAAGY